MEKQVDASHYKYDKYMNIGRMVSYHCQIEECIKDKSVSKIVIIGVGDGMVIDIIRETLENTKVITVDLADDLNPDVICDVLELSKKADVLGDADIVMCCQVLEHLPYDKFEPALEEIKKILKPGGKLVLSLPDSGRIVKVIIDFFDFHLFKRKSFCKMYLDDFPFNGEHYWEINSCKKYPLKRVKKSVMNVFTIESQALAIYNDYHRFFICRKQ